MGGSISSEIDRLAKQDPPIQKLDVRQKSLTEIPPNINTLKALTDLNGSYNQIKTIPPSLGQVKTLKILNLANNKLDELPQELTDLVNLIELNLSINKIKLLPRGFGSYKALRLLDLSHNMLEELPSQVGLLGTLKELYLSFNQLKRLPPELGKCGNIEKITLSNNKLRFIPAELAQNQYLKTLDLTGNKIKVIPPEVAEIPELSNLGLSLNPVIKSIDQAARKGPKALLEFLRSDAYDQEYYTVRLFVCVSSLTDTTVQERTPESGRGQLRREEEEEGREEGQEEGREEVTRTLQILGGGLRRVLTPKLNSYRRDAAMPTRGSSSAGSRKNSEGRRTMDTGTACLLGSLLLEGDDGLLAHGVENRDEDLLAVIDESTDLVAQLALRELEVLLGSAVRQEKAAEAVVGHSEGLDASATANNKASSVRTG